MLQRITQLLFPPKCILCRTLLQKHETDLCHACRTDAPEFTKAKIKLSFLAGWTAVWYYKDTVRQSLLRYKFYNARSYADVYGRFLAMKLQTEGFDDFDVLDELEDAYEDIEDAVEDIAEEPAEAFDFFEF